MYKIYNVVYTMLYVLLFNKTSMFENKCYCCSKAYVKSNVKWLVT